MKYTIKAHPTIYNNVLFRSRLEARWAAFFDLAGWEWEYEPIDLEGWSPDFRVTFFCPHSECNGEHTLLVEIKPYYSLKDFEGHPCLDYPFGYYQEKINGEWIDLKKIPADASAAFGNNPNISEWEMVHGAGGGIYSIDEWVDNIDTLWKIAGTITQYKPRSV